MNSSIPIEDLANLSDLDPSCYPNRELTADHDAWHIVYASGGIEHFFDLAPYDLPNLIWQRDGKEEARIHNYEKIKLKIHHGKRTKSSTGTRSRNSGSVHK